MTVKLTASFFLAATSTVALIVHEILTLNKKKFTWRIGPTKDNFGTEVSRAMLVRDNVTSKTLGNNFFLFSSLC